MFLNTNIILHLLHLINNVIKYRLYILVFQKFLDLNISRFFGQLHFSILKSFNLFVEVGFRK